MIASDLPLPESDRSSGHSRCQVRTPHGRVTCPNALIGRSSIRPPAAAPDLRIAMRDIQVSCLGHILARECRSPMSTRHRSNQSNTSADNPILFGLRRGWTANDRHLRARVKAGNVSSVVRSDPGPTKLLIRSRPQSHQLRPMRLASLSEQLRDGCRQPLASVYSLQEPRARIGRRQELGSIELHRGGFRERRLGRSV